MKVNMSDGFTLSPESKVDRLILMTLVRAETRRQESMIAQFGTANISIRGEIGDDGAIALEYWGRELDSLGMPEVLTGSTRVCVRGGQVDPEAAFQWESASLGFDFRDATGNMAISHEGLKSIVAARRTPEA